MLAPIQARRARIGIILVESYKPHYIVHYTTACLLVLSRKLPRRFVIGISDQSSIIPQHTSGAHFPQMCPKIAFNLFFSSSFVRSLPSSIFRTFIKRSPYRAFVTFKLDEVVTWLSHTCKTWLYLASDKKGTVFRRVGSPVDNEILTVLQIPCCNRRFPFVD